MEERSNGLIDAAVCEVGVAIFERFSEEEGREEIGVMDTSIWSESFGLAMVDMLLG